MRSRARLQVPRATEPTCFVVFRRIWDIGMSFYRSNAIHVIEWLYSQLGGGIELRCHCIDFDVFGMGAWVLAATMKD